MAGLSGTSLCAPLPDLGCVACCPPIRPAGYDHQDWAASLARLWAENRASWRAGSPPRPMVGFWCSGLGWLDGRRRVAGCLYHPAQNGGVDHRGPTGYQPKCARETCPQARVWAGLDQAVRDTLLAPCLAMDSFGFSARRNPLRRVLALGRTVAAHAANLGPGWAEKSRLPSAPAWGWLLGLGLEAGRWRLDDPGLENYLVAAVTALRAQLAPPPRLEPWHWLCEETEARFWRAFWGSPRGQAAWLDSARAHLTRWWV